MKFCTDCSFEVRGQCFHPRNIGVSAITGMEAGPIKGLTWLRTGKRDDECGESGKWFEARASCLAPMNPDQYFDGRGELREQRHIEGHH